MVQGFWYPRRGLAFAASVGVDVAVPVAVQSNFAATAALIDRPAHAFAVVTVAFFWCAAATFEPARTSARQMNVNFIKSPYFSLT
ncbi:hypothetical protein X739_14070 [Mesorhizobium sp. LNHC220B00]|nr:hypothetical protein X739_14070 [Mesorhizobium sp. LNHC220B00]ESY90813.1 hypothetical protein X741_25985 [Mesorhizobium sp. LNHC229A00]ESY92416.1 hypothetical protein X738_27355 [Mesorhizobium sp. LNHC209A00]